MDLFYEAATSLHYFVAPAALKSVQMLYIFRESLKSVNKIKNT